MHNGIVDVLITLRCYIKYIYDIDIYINNDKINKLFQIYNINS